MFKYFIVAIFFLFTTKVFGQSFYVVTSNSLIKKITINSAGISEQDVNSCITDGAGNIAIRNNTLYYNNSFPLGKSTISGNSLIDCTILGNVPLSNSLTADINGFLYSVNGSILYKTDPANMNTTTIGDMLYRAAGDLIFYKNDLYMASTQGIVKVNIANPSQSTLVVSALTNVWGLATVPYSSTQNKVYGFEINNIGYTDIYEIDLDNNQLGAKVGTLPYTVYDAASEVEDGSLSKIKIERIRQFADCPYTGKGTIQVICTNPLVDYQYKLEGITNSTGIFTNLDPGTYHVSVISAVETKDTVITVSQFEFEKPVLNITTLNPVCVAAGQIKIAAAANGDLYSIKYGNDIFDFDHTFTNLTSGDYHFTILNKAGCEVDHVNETLTQDQCKITIINTAITEECDNPGKGMVEISTAPNNDIYTYSINSTTNGTGIFNNLDAGTYQVNIVSSNGDTKNLPVVIPDYNSSKPIITVYKKNPVCDTAGTISFTLQNGNVALYRLQQGSTIFSFDHVFTGLAAGSYHFNIIKQDNCLLAIEDVVLVQDKCTIKLDNTTINEECNLPGKGVITINTKPHSYNYTYTLNNGISNNTGIFNNLLPGNYSVKVTSSEDEQIVNATVPDYNVAKPTVTYFLTNAVCDTAGTVKLIMQNTDTSAYRVKLGNDIFDFDHLFTGLAEGNYNFDVIKQDDCILTTVNVSIGRSKCNIVLEGTDVQQECNLIYKGSIHVNSSPHSYVYTYELNNSITNTTGVFNNLDPGQYTITVTSVEDVKQISVVVPNYKLSSPAISFITKDAICELKGDAKFSLTVNSNQYKIELNSSVYPFSHDFNDLDAGSYDFKVLKPDDCILDVLTINIKKEACEVLLFPNAFTPNGDGINDIFEPNQDARATNFKFRIYNRYGILIFTSESSHNGWNGEYNGKQVPVGVYYWIATYINNEGKSLTKKGYVTLIR